MSICMVFGHHMVEKESIYMHGAYAAQVHTNGICKHCKRPMQLEEQVHPKVRQYVEMYKDTLDHYAARVSELEARIGAAAAQPDGSAQELAKQNLATQEALANIQQMLLKLMQLAFPNQ